MNLQFWLSLVILVFNALLIYSGIELAQKAEQADFSGVSSAADLLKQEGYAIRWMAYGVIANSTLFIGLVVLIWWQMKRQLELINAVSKATSR